MGSGMLLVVAAMQFCVIGWWVSSGGAVCIEYGNLSCLLKPFIGFEPFARECGRVFGGVILNEGLSGVAGKRMRELECRVEPVLDLGGVEAVVTVGVEALEISNFTVGGWLQVFRGGLFDRGGM